METTVELIARKRNGEALTEAQIQRLVTGLLDGTLADYQMSAFLMAVYFRGMTEHCLFGVRGRLPYRLKPDGTRAQGRTVIFDGLPDMPEAFEAPVPSERGKRIHSRKPEQMREYVRLVSGPVLRLECYARVASEGFDVWGNQAPEVTDARLG